MIRTYSELVKIKSYADRLQYLMLYGTPGDETFGSSRYINQKFYKSKEWNRARRLTIERDSGFDLGVSTHPILGNIYVHHMNPLTLKDIMDNYDLALNLEYLITVSFQTHQTIHYAVEEVKEIPIVLERTEGDTKLW